MSGRLDAPEDDKDLLRYANRFRPRVIVIGSGGARAGSRREAWRQIAGRVRSGTTATGGTVARGGSTATAVAAANTEHALTGSGVGSSLGDRVPTCAEAVSPLPPDRGRVVSIGDASSTLSIWAGSATPLRARTWANARAVSGDSRSNTDRSAARTLALTGCPRWVFCCRAQETYIMQSELRVACVRGSLTVSRGVPRVPVCVRLRFFDVYPLNKNVKYIFF